MSNRDFAKHNGLIAFIAILLVLILVGGIIGGLYYFNRCLFGHDYDENGVCTRCGEEKLDKVEKEPDKEDPNEENKEANVNGGGMATVLPGSGIRLIASAQPISTDDEVVVAETTWTLTATVNEEADDTYLNWSINWKDASSTWASGKTVTEYMTVEPSTEGALTATVTCLKPFGEQVEVKVTSRSNPEMSDTCLFDYVQRLTALTFNMPAVTDMQPAISYSFKSSDYTIAATVALKIKSQPLSLSKPLGGGSSDAFELFLTEDFSSSLKAQAQRVSSSISIGNYCHLSLSGTGQSGKLTLRQDEFPQSVSLTVPTGVAGIFVVAPTSAGLRDTQLLAVFRDAVTAVSGTHATFVVNYTAKYDGKTYTSEDYTVNVRFDKSAFSIPLNTLELNEDHIYA